MTEIATIDWFGRWGTSVFSEKHCYICTNVTRSTKKNFEKLIYRAKVLTDHPKNCDNCFFRSLFRNEFWNIK